MRQQLSIALVLVLIVAAGPAAARKECRPAGSDGPYTEFGQKAATAALPSIFTTDETGAPTDEGLDCTISRQRNECRVLTNQVAHFRYRESLARERGDDLYEQAMGAHVERLALRYERLCPAAPPLDDGGFNRAFANFLRSAAKAAVRFFTMGGI